MKKLTSIILFVVFLGTTGCDNFLDITPTGRVIPETAKDYRELLTRAYSMMPDSRGLTAFIADEIVWILTMRLHSWIFGCGIT
mgnify:CR=1 FL=1